VRWLLLWPVLPATWRAFGSLVASLAASAASAALLLLALVLGLAWLTGVTAQLLVFGLGLAARLVWKVARREGRRTSGRTRPPRTRWAAESGTLLIAVTTLASARLAALDRRRASRVSGAPVAAGPWPATAGLPWRERRRVWLDSPVVRRGALYQLARLPAIVAIASALTVVCVLMGLGLSGHLWPHGTYKYGLGLAIGVVCVFVWPVVARVGSALEVALARALLGPSRTGQLSAEVEHLGAARDQAVESADSERRRIERDLHDGLQPRLVSLALELGIARSRFERDPDYARSLLEQAHEEAKIAIQDLRSLVRGIHPSVLDERGLDAALSALVASCAVPVRVVVSLTRRPDRPREAVAYFVVAEAITNVAKHSGAGAASVIVTDEDRYLRVLVEDDGKGSAAIEPGGGLAGLAARVAAIDGTLTVTSPPGGPTRVEAVLPCER
jgi:signal transduction histidine kinase